MRLRTAHVSRSQAKARAKESIEIGEIDELFFTTATDEDVRAAVDAVTNEPYRGGLVRFPGRRGDSVDSLSQFRSLHW